MNNINLITVSEYSKLHGKSTSTVKEHIKNGRIYAEKIEGIWYIEKDTPYPTCVRYKDITDQRFGKLVAKKFVGKSKSGVALWDCVCDCGNHKIVSVNNLKCGDTKSCGCIFSEREGIDIKCKKFGRLTVLKPTEKRDSKGSVVWECSCNCGNPDHVYVSVRCLNSGAVTSCGCKKVETLKKVQKNGVESAQNSPKSGRFETNINAKEWELIAPDGTVHKCINLRLWARNHTELFDFPHGDDSARKIAHGFENIAQTYYGNRTGVYTYKGWSLKSVPQKNSEE